MYNIYYNIYY